MVASLTRPLFNFTKGMLRNDKSVANANKILDYKRQGLTHKEISKLPDIVQKSESGVNQLISRAKTLGANFPIAGARAADQSKRDLALRLAEQYRSERKFVKFKDLAKEVGIHPSTKSNLNKHFGREDWLASPTEIVQKSFDDIVSDPNAVMSSLKNLNKQISKNTNVNVHTVSTALNSHAPYKELSPIIKSSTNKFAQTKSGSNVSDITLGEAIDNAAASGLKTDALTRTGYTSPSQRIMGYVNRAVNQGSETVEWLIPPTIKGKTVNYTNAIFKYYGKDGAKNYDMSILKDKINIDPNFNTIVGMMKQQKNLSRRMVDHPVKGRSTYSELMRDAGISKRNQAPLQIDHKDLINNPFENLRLLDARTNQAHGALKSMATKDPSLKNILDPAIKKIGYNYNKTPEQLIEDQVALAHKILLGARTGKARVLKPAPTQAVDSVKYRGGHNEGGMVDEALRENFNLGGFVADNTKGNLGSISGKRGDLFAANNKVGVIHSMLAGIGAGIIDIPKGAFTLGAALVDLGLGTHSAAKVENFFDDLTNWDEKAEQSAMGSLTRIVTNLGIPGAKAAKIGSDLTKRFLKNKKNGTYFKVTDPKIEGRMKEALNAKGRLYTTLGGAAGVGVSDAIFVGDPEKVGTLGDAFGMGPTKLKPNDSQDAGREVMNRLKFGLDSSLLLGVVGGTGSAIKSGIKRRQELEINDDFIDKIFSKFRPRGDKPQEFFDLTRKQLGLRARDVNKATEIQRGVNRHIDALFPNLRDSFDKTTLKTREKLLDELNEVLLSGSTDIDVTGKFAFGQMDKTLKDQATRSLQKLGAKKENIQGIFNSFEDMRAEWGNMFTSLGGRMDEKTLTEFSKGFGSKVKDYLGSTYRIFDTPNLTPMANFKPGAEAIKKAMDMFKESSAKAEGFTKTVAVKNKKTGEFEDMLVGDVAKADAAKKGISDESARYYVDQILETATAPRGLATGSDKELGVLFKVPGFFANKTTLDDLYNNRVGVSQLDSNSKEVVENLLGKVSDPTQTILAGTNKLSLLTQRNKYFDDLLESSNLAQKTLNPETGRKSKGFFYDDELDAVTAFGRNNIRQINMDPAKTLVAGKEHALNGKYALKSVADALEETNKNFLGDSMFNTIYNNFVLYPKATSQLAKTVLSPITHVRNFVSAGAFAAGNGIIPNVESFKTAFKSLQVDRLERFGAQADNKLYRKLLELGVVNSNVKLGDLQKLLRDVEFGSKAGNVGNLALRKMLQKGSRLKKEAEQFYTAEDDFWKITSWAMERERYANAYKKAGIIKSADELDEIAADIVRNNIPNYDYVSDFVKGLRKFPMGNFVSFPAEIMRTSYNILERSFREINAPAINVGGGKMVNPLKNIGYQRLMGFGATAVAIPYGTVEAFKMVYNVSGVEMDALRRFVPDWSKNSTLIPIRNDDNTLNYVDFSHANAYDTVIRPFTTMINAVRDGVTDEEPVMQSIMKGMFEATSELGKPFISEAIWTEAALDIIARGGRTREGRRLYTEQTPNGEKVTKIMGHIVESQMPGSVGQLKRIGLSITDQTDKYGQRFEVGDELAGILGMRSVKVDPVRAMKYKIADFTSGINNARREFTSPLLKGGAVTPEQIVDRYMTSNESLYKVQKNMNQDYFAALTLGANPGSLDLEFKDRVSNIQLNSIKRGLFKPFIPSDNIIKSFRENATKLGVGSPYDSARATIERLARQYQKSSLMDNGFPIFDNPFAIQETTLPTENMFQTGTQSNLPNLNTNLLGVSGNSAINNPNSTLARMDAIDKIMDI